MLSISSADSTVSAGRCSDPDGSLDSPCALGLAANGIRLVSIRLVSVVLVPDFGSVTVLELAATVLELAICSSAVTVLELAICSSGSSGSGVRVLGKRSLYSGRCLSNSALALLLLLVVVHLGACRFPVWSCVSYGIQ